MNKKTECYFYVMIKLDSQQIQSPKEEETK